MSVVSRRVSITERGSETELSFEHRGKSDVRRRKTKSGGLLRLFYGDSVLRFGYVAIQSGKLLVIDLGFGEQNLPGMVFFRHLVLLLFAGVVLFRALLRFEPNFYFPPFGS